VLITLTCGPPIFNARACPKMVIIETRMVSSVSSGDVYETGLSERRLLTPEISRNGLREYRVSFADLHPSHRGARRIYHAVSANLKPNKVWVEISTRFRITVFTTTGDSRPVLDMIEPTANLSEPIRAESIFATLPIWEFDPWCQDQTPLQKRHVRSEQRLAKKLPTCWDRISEDDE